MNKTEIIRNRAATNNIHCEDISMSKPTHRIYVDDKQIAFMQGELVSCARFVVQEHRQNERYTDDWDGNTMADRELKRLIGNLFGWHNNDIGDPIQLAMLIMFLHGEQTESF